MNEQTTAASGFKLDNEEIVTIVCSMNACLEGRRRELEKVIKKGKALLSICDLTEGVDSIGLMGINSTTGESASGAEMREVIEKGVSEAEAELKGLGVPTGTLYVMSRLVEKLRPAYELIRSSEGFEDIAKATGLNKEAIL